MDTTKTPEATKDELIVVLKDPSKMEDAKALITNSGLKWEKLLFNQKDLKIALIKVPEDKRDFWLERLQQSGTFSSVELNGIATIQDIEKNHKNSLVKIRKTACFGRCAVYEFTIFKDGKSLFNGLQNVNKTGKHQITLSKEQFIGLKDKLNKTDFSKYNEDYNNPRITDLPSLYITYQGKQIQIRIWKNVPEELKELTTYIEEIVKVNQLTN